MRSYFISDVHLGLGSREEEKAKEDFLLGFLASIQADAEALFIIGDLFDFWFEYRTVIPKGFHRTLSAIQQFTDRGIPVHYVAGNHDFWMRDFFSTELGVVVHRDPVELPIGGRRVLLHHGDGLARNDVGYRIIKPVLRNRAAIFFYRWLHPDIGVPLARGSSRTSRAYTGQKDYGEADGMTEYAARRISEGAEIVIMGHRHVPVQTALHGGTYINLGDWVDHHTYAVLEHGAINLRTWTGTRN